MNYCAECHYASPDHQSNCSEYIPDDSDLREENAALAFIAGESRPASADPEWDGD